MSQLRIQDLHFVVSRIPRDVLKMVQDNSLFIAGGFIRSTIGDEKASDIDIFGASKDALKAVAMQFALDRGFRQSTSQPLVMSKGTGIRCIVYESHLGETLKKSLSDFLWNELFL